MTTMTALRAPISTKACNDDEDGDAGVDGRREQSGRDDDEDSDRSQHIHAVPGLPQLPWEQDAGTHGLSRACTCVVNAWVRDRQNAGTQGLYGSGLQA